MKWTVTAIGGLTATILADRWDRVDLGDESGIGFYKNGSDAMVAWFSGPQSFALIEEDAGEPAPASRGRRAAPGLGTEPIATDGSNRFSPSEVLELMKEKVGERTLKDVAAENEWNVNVLGQVMRGNSRATGKMITWLGLQSVTRRTRGEES
jgi:hypothetical protein